MPWPTSPSAPYTNMTLRTVLRASVEGRAARVRLSNDLGQAPVGLARRIVAESMRTLHFPTGGHPVIPARLSVTSDPVALAIPARAEVVVSVFVPGPVNMLTGHLLGLDPTYVALGDHAATTDFPAIGSTSVRALVNEVDVDAGWPRGHDRDAGRLDH